MSYKHVQCAGFALSVLVTGVGWSLLTVIDTNTALWAEIACLFLRAGNELIHGKADWGDAVHHLGMVFAVAIAGQWYSHYAAVILHMQVLHVPMLVYYLGGRRNAVLPAHFQPTFFSAFAVLWAASAAYRLSLMVYSAGCAAADAEVVLLVVFGVCFTTLDFNWTSAFGIFQWAGTTNLRRLALLLAAAVGAACAWRPVT